MAETIGGGLPELPPVPAVAVSQLSCETRAVSVLACENFARIYGISAWNFAIEAAAKLMTDLAAARTEYLTHFDGTEHERVWHTAIVAAESSAPERIRSLKRCTDGGVALGQLPPWLSTVENAARCLRIANETLPGDIVCRSAAEELEALAARARGVEAWRDPDTGRTVPKPQPTSMEQARAALGVGTDQP